MDTRTFPTSVLISVTSGRLLCDNFGQVQETGDFITGQPTLTHNYASEAFWKRLRTTIVHQHPGLADEDKLFADYPDLDGQPQDEVRKLIDQWLEEHVYPSLGRELELHPEPEHTNVGFMTGLEGHEHKVAAIVVAE